MEPFGTVQALHHCPADQVTTVLGLAGVWAEAAWQSPVRSVACAPGGGRGPFNVLP